MEDRALVKIHLRNAKVIDGTGWHLTGIIDELIAHCYVICEPAGVSYI
jgi:hypothetical protein